jgi:RNA polymerase sigma factor (sigma-70 family)
MPPNQRATEDEQLVERCRQGDATAWQALVSRYAPLVHSVPVRYGFTRAEVEDVAQEVFLALAQGLSQIEQIDRLPAWLLTTARRYSWRVMRNRNREQPLAGGDLADLDPPTARPLSTPAPTMHELLVGWERQEILGQALERLSLRCRTLLTLIFLDPDEPSYDLIAERLGIPKGSIGPTRSRCLNQLRRLLDDSTYDYGG